MRADFIPALFLVASVCEARNQVPAHIRHDGARHKSAAVEAFSMEAPTMRARLGIRHDVGMEGDTYNSETFWLDSLLQQELWAAAGGMKQSKHHLGRRAPARVGSPLFQPNCLGCINSSKDKDKDQDTNTYTWQYMQSMMLENVNTKDTCVFYTGLPESDKHALELSSHSIYFGNRPKDQSRAATVYACANNLVSIWTLWPGENENWDQSSEDKTKYNFYEVRRGSWLDALYSEETDPQVEQDNADQRRRHYFRAMSQAMAESCRGIVYVMAVRLDNMGGYIGIWPDTEYPALWRLYKKGVVTRLIGIDALDPRNQYEMKFNDPDTGNPNYPTRGARITPRDGAYLDLASLVEQSRAVFQKRDTCSSTLAWSDATPWDWFG